MYRNSIPKESVEDLIPLTISLSEHIWGKPTEERIDAIKEFLEKASAKLGINTPVFLFDDNKIAYKLTAGGRCLPVSNTIILYHKFSLLTLLHEFRHIMQYQLTGFMPYDANLEEDARMWSCSLFAYALPDKYIAAVSAGNIRFEHLEPIDLTSAEF